MGPTKFDKQVEESAGSLAFGIGRVVAGRDVDGVRRTDATFWRAGTRVLLKVEGRVRRRSYQPGWRRLAFRAALGAGVSESAYLASGHPRATARTVQEVWAYRDQALSVLGPAGIGAASFLTAGTAAYLVLTRERQQTRHCRVYLSNVPPGFLQTPAFATALMNQITTFQGPPTTLPKPSPPAPPAPDFSTKAATATSSSSRSPSCDSAQPTPTRCAASCATSWP